MGVFALPQRLEKRHRQRILLFFVPPGLPGRPRLSRNFLGSAPHFPSRGQGVKRLHLGDRPRRKQDAHRVPEGTEGPLGQKFTQRKLFLTKGGKDLLPHVGKRLQVLLPSGVAQSRNDPDLLPVPSAEGNVNKAPPAHRLPQRRGDIIAVFPVRRPGKPQQPDTGKGSVLRRSAAGDRFKEEILF